MYTRWSDEKRNYRPKHQWYAICHPEGPVADGVRTKPTDTYQIRPTKQKRWFEYHYTSKPLIVYDKSVQENSKIIQTDESEGPERLQ